MSASTVHTAVFITYNSIGRGLIDGLHRNGNNQVFVFQGFIRKDSSGPDLDEKRRTMVLLWRQVCRTVDLREVDLFVLYCGKIPAVSIWLGAGLPLHRLCFVHCGCGNLSIPFRRDLDMEGASWIQSECGGIETLYQIYQRFMKHGEIAATMNLKQGMELARRKK